MSVATLDVSSYRPLERSEFASFWRRLVAAILDGFVLQVIAGITGQLTAGLILADLPIVDALYPVGFIAYGATPGMRALGIRVVDADRNRPGFARSIRRFILPALALIPWLIFFRGPGWLLDLQVSVSIVALLALIAISILDPLWMIWDDHKQMLHDKLAGTYVIRE